MSIIKKIKKRVLICGCAIIAGLTFSVSYAVFVEPKCVSADENVQHKGYVKYGVTKLRIRTSTDTSSEDNVIKYVDAGFRFDIYDTVFSSNNYAWYSIGFYTGDEYKRGYIAEEFVEIEKDNISYDSSLDFEEYLSEQGFPESYKEGLRQLHNIYPKWTFIADHTGVDWNTLVDNENVVGRNVVSVSAPDSWKSTESGCYDWSTGEYKLFDGYWAQASTEVVEYMLDPRNFFNSTNIFMYESLSYNENLQSREGVNNIIDGSFMDSGNYLDNSISDYASALMQAGKQSGVSPYHLATRIINELGRNNPGDIISGNVSGFVGIYNYYNISAVNNGSGSATTNGLRYAEENDQDTLRPWDTRYKAIAGGAIVIGQSYISVGQNTLYYQKFDIKNYWHQYMTHVFAPKSESNIASEAYSDSIKNNTALVFTIPVYNNMPSSVCELPEENYGNVNNKLKSLSVDGYSLTPTYDIDNNYYDLIVDNSTSYVEVSGTLVDDYATVTGLGRHELSVGSNKIDITVTSQSGNDNIYTINVVREGGNTTGKGDGFTTKYSVDDSVKTICNISAGTSVDDFKNSIVTANGVSSKVVSKEDKEAQGKIATGDKLELYNASKELIGQYSIVVYGDANGDGEIDIFDVAKIKRYKLGYISLDGVYLEAADCNHDGEVDIFDVAAIKRNVLGTKTISQK